MEVIPGGQPDTTVGKLSIDTLDSTPPPRQEPQGTDIATQDGLRNEQRVTPHNASGRKQYKVWEKDDIVNEDTAHTRCGNKETGLFLLLISGHVDDEVEGRALTRGLPSAVTQMFIHAHRLVWL